MGKLLLAVKCPCALALAHGKRALLPADASSPSPSAARSDIGKNGSKDVTESSVPTLVFLTLA